MPQTTQPYFLIYARLPIVTYGMIQLLSGKYPFSGFRAINTKGHLVCTLRNSVDRAIIVLCIQFKEFIELKYSGFIAEFAAKHAIIIFAPSGDAVYAPQYFSLGIKGFVSQEEVIDEFVKAIEDVMDGNVYVSKTVVTLISSAMNADDKSNPFNKLTEREFGIMKLFAKGYRVKNIAAQLNLHSSTIGTFKSKIFTKLNVKNIIDLKEIATENGIDIS